MKTGFLCWLVPVMSFSILVGLSLDYDVFLISRIVEYRELGVSDEGSILFGLYKTGRIITAAGIIMAIAFAGLLMSEEGTMNQLSFFLVRSKAQNDGFLHYRCCIFHSKSWVL